HPRESLGVRFLTHARHVVALPAVRLGDTGRVHVRPGTLQGPSMPQQHVHGASLTRTPRGGFDRALAAVGNRILLNGSTAVPVASSAMDTEKRLEDVLAHDISILGLDRL